MTATAKVTVTLEIDAGSSWGDNCTVAQIRKQAGEEAIIRLDNLLRSAKTKFRIVGTPAVKTVIH